MFGRCGSAARGLAVAAGRAGRVLAAAVMLMALAVAATPALGEGPIRLHPENPHYLQFRGKPTVLVTSGEHYGAVLNGEFDYEPYLDELAEHGLNQTRTFSGAYREVESSFDIADNPLAPDPEHYVSPWPRSDEPGANDGGNKFDLSRFNEAYFERLKDFLSEAAERGVVVEFVFFCPFYEEVLWEVNPMNAANNINGVGNVGREAVYALEEEALTEVQMRFVEKVVRELNGFDNLYYEICNEPYFHGVTEEWQRRVAETIVETEEGLAKMHLIAQNIANESARIEDPDPRVSIFNFHYAEPVAVTANYDLNKPIGDDETGFDGQADGPYRAEAWNFMLAGGAIFSHLDYSFTPEHPDGTAELRTSPGGGGESIRRQLGFLKRFMEGLDFVAMAPDNSVILDGVPEGAEARALVEPGEAYAIYIDGGSEASLALELPSGRYRARWMNTKTGEVAKRQSLDHDDGRTTLRSPEYERDIALRIVRREGE